jgi:hypothetical protein
MQSTKHKEQNAMPADPRIAGAKGGRSKSPAKLAACRKNGFQKVTQPAPRTAPAQPEQKASE